MPSTQIKNFMKNSKNLFRLPCEFFAGAANPGQIPNSNLPEFAFVGRSNVGKSSLINALTHRKSLARVSQQPGRTRQINFFDLGGVLSLVDLPGYGFARISNQERNSWDRLIYKYIVGRIQLKRVFLLIDSRHELKEIDMKMMTFLDDCVTPYQIILTKTDKSKMLADVVATLEETIKKRGACYPEIILTSSSTKTGVDKLQAAIVAML